MDFYGSRCRYFCVHKVFLHISAKKNLINATVTTSTSVKSLEILSTLTRKLRVKLKCTQLFYSINKSSSNHIILAYNMIGATFGLINPPIVHVIIDFMFFICMQSLAYFTYGLMMSKSSGIKIPPPKIFIEFRIICI